MLARKIMQFPSDRDEPRRGGNSGSDDAMPNALSSMVASLNKLAVDRGDAQTDRDGPGLDELAATLRARLLDVSVDADEAGSFLRHLIEVYVDRFQAFPFDGFEALFRCLELQQASREQMHDLVERLERLYEARYGAAMPGSLKPSRGEAARQPTLDQEISQLRETLKYAAIAGERQNDK